MTSHPCAIPGCAALADWKGGECAPRRAGYRVAKDYERLRCSHCRHLISKDTWYRRVGDGVQHVKACTIHPDVKKERDAKEQAAAR